MSKKSGSVVEKEVSQEPVRKPFVKGFRVQLFKKRDAPVSSAKGFTVRMLNDKGEPDYSQPAALVWFAGLDRLRAGNWLDCDGYILEPREGSE